VSETKPQKS